MCRRRGCNGWMRQVHHKAFSAFFSSEAARSTIVHNGTQGIYNSIGATSMVCIRITYDFYLQIPHLQSYTRNSIANIHHRQIVSPMPTNPQKNTTRRHPNLRTSENATCADIACCVVRARPRHDSHGEVEDSPFLGHAVDVHESIREGACMAHKFPRMSFFVGLVVV